MVSDFMEAQINSLEDEKAYIQCFREGLDEARDAGKLSDRRLHQEIAPYLRRIRKTSGTLKVLKRQKKVLTEDLQEEMAIKKKRSNTSPDEGLLRRAYRDTIVPRVMGAVTKVAERKFNQRRFKKGVEKHYGIREHCPKGYSWCHVLGRYEPAATVKAAHLVPKSLTDDEVAHLFGGEHKVQCDPQNGKQTRFLSLKGGPNSAHNIILCRSDTELGARAAHGPRCLCHCPNTRGTNNTYHVEVYRVK